MNYSKKQTRSCGVATLGCLLLLAACGDGVSPRTGGETHWLQCVSSNDCDGGAMPCVCGLCTPDCSTSDECTGLGHPSVCWPQAGHGSTGICTANATTGQGGACLPQCTTNADCAAVGAGFVCAGSGVCQPGDSNVDLDLDMGVGDVAPGSDAVGGDLNPDATPTPLSMCVITIEGATKTTICDVSPRSMIGCEALAECFCRYSMSDDATQEELDNCVFSTVVARGNITLADFCTYSGTASDVDSLSDLMVRIDDGAGIDSPLPQQPTTVRLSSECDEVASFTLWGDSPTALFLSLLHEDATLPAVPVLLEDYTFDGEPLLNLEDIVSYDAGSGELVITEVARAVLVSRLGDTASLVGRAFVFHHERSGIQHGLFVTLAMSSTREGTTVVVEELDEAELGTITLHEGYPSQGPAVLNMLIQGRLAGTGRQLDAMCISSCGCQAGAACREGVCTELTSGCQTDADCCLSECDPSGQCVGG